MKTFLKYFFIILITFSEIFNLHIGLYAQQSKKIAAFGSSVCYGTGDQANLGGYIGRFKSLMAKYGWEVINVSRGGDNTLKIQDRWEKSDKGPRKPTKDDQYLLPHKPNVVIIGLSLANEGIRKDTKSAQDSVFQQFRSGMLGIIERCRNEGFKVVVANCYPHSFYTSEQYEEIKKMNLVINSWGVPSINLLGATDDGLGHWIDGFYRDEGHPSGAGHQEIFFTIVPTLFDAIEQGKTLPEFAKSKNYAYVEGNDAGTIIYEPKDTIHSFTLSFLIRNADDFIAADISGKKTVVIKSEYKYKEKNQYDNLIISSEENASVSLKLIKGYLIYNSETGINYSGKNKLDENKWYRVTISHCVARSETLIFLDDSLIIKVTERIIPEKFCLGLKGNADLKDVLIYRSSINQNEIKSIVNGYLFQSSLEIYSSLDDGNLPLSGLLNNLAQSTSNLKINGKIKFKNN